MKKPIKTIISGNSCEFKLTRSNSLTEIYEGCPILFTCTSGERAFSTHSSGTFS